MKFLQNQTKLRLIFDQNFRIRISDYARQSASGVGFWRTGLNLEAFQRSPGIRSIRLVGNFRTERV